MQKLIIIVILGLFSSRSIKGQELLIVMGKTVLIKGKTSLGRFSCAYENDKIDSVSLSTKTKVPSLLDINIPVASFDCGNRMLERDFNKTLNGDQYPIIEVKLDDVRKKGGMFFGDFWVKLKEKTLKMDDIPFTIHQSIDGIILFSEIELSLAYFELTPPKKLFGLIKVHDDLKIEVRLKL
jgi:hypothetical protein